MLKELYPREYKRYLTLPLLGPALANFEPWLLERGFCRGIRRQKCRDAVRVGRFLIRRGVKRAPDITRIHLEACRQWYRLRNPSIAGTAKSLAKFLGELGLLRTPRPIRPTADEAQVEAYTVYLRGVRGLSPPTCQSHAFTAREFLHHLRHHANRLRLARLGAKDIEEFVRKRGQCLRRGSLQHTVAQLRSFLRFLAISGAIQPGLEAQIDTPRLYRLEQLPRALPWNVVRSFLASIDRSTPKGLRDYAMFALIATYGLRTSQVAALTLDDVHWRERWILVSERKKGNPLKLPLTDPVATALVRYLRRGRPPSTHREIFLRLRAPAGILKPTAVTEAFQGCSRRSGLNIPYQGPHCIRHSYAVHLLRKGMSLKTIGDLLGHKTAESTCVYLRLDVDDLRTVALPVPRQKPTHRRKEAQS